jgi:hypothetical protein
MASVDVYAVHNGGGLLGVNSWLGLVSGSFSEGDVNGVQSDSTSFGGLAGHNQGRIENSYAKGNVSASDRVGGLVGTNYTNQGQITNSYSTGHVTGTTSVGGLIGSNSSNTNTGNYWDIQTSGQSSSASGTGLTTAQMKQQPSYGWNFSDAWRIDNGNAYPKLAWQSLTSSGINIGDIDPDNSPVPVSLCATNPAACKGPEIIQGDIGDLQDDDDLLIMGGIPGGESGATPINTPPVFTIDFVLHEFNKLNIGSDELVDLKNKYYSRPDFTNLPDFTIEYPGFFGNDLLLNDYILEKRRASLIEAKINNFEGFVSAFEESISGHEVDSIYIKRVGHYVSMIDSVAKAENISNKPSPGFIETLKRNMDQPIDALRTLSSGLETIAKFSLPSDKLTKLLSSKKKIDAIKQTAVIAPLLFNLADTVYGVLTSEKTLSPENLEKLYSALNSVKDSGLLSKVEGGLTIYNAITTVITSFEVGGYIEDSQDLELTEKQLIKTVIDRQVISNLFNVTSGALKLFSEFEDMSSAIDTLNNFYLQATNEDTRSIIYSLNNSLSSLQIINEGYMKSGENLANLLQTYY